MSADLFAYAYALTIAAGGIVGFIKSGSVMSGLMGVAFGAVAGFGAYKVSQNPNNYYVCLGVSAILTGVMGSRALNSGKFMPAGLVTVLSLAMLVRYGMRMVQGTGAAKQKK